MTRTSPAWTVWRCRRRSRSGGRLGDEGDLLVGVGVAGDDAAFGEDDAGEHGLFAGDELAREERIELLVFDVVPTVESGVGHGGSAFLLR